MMKSFLTLGMATLVAMRVMAGPPKENEKTMWKNAKKQAATMTNQGWQVDGTITMEEAYYKHALKKQQGGLEEISTSITGDAATRTLNQAQQWTITNAYVSYAKSAGMSLRGRITSEIAAGVDAASLDNFYEGYEALVQKNIQGELKKSFSIYRKTTDGKIEYQAFYLIDEEAASKARMRAMEMMMKESEFARQHAEDISKFVQEGFKE